MVHRSRTLMALAVALAIAGVSALLFTVPVLAQQPVAGTHVLSDGAVGPALPSAGAANQPTDVVVLLSGPPLYDLYRRERDRVGATGTAPVVAVRTLETWLSAIEARQQAATVRLESIGATVISRYQVVLNGLLVRATPAQVRAIAAMPGVTSVTPAPEVTVDLDHSVPHIGATQVKDNLGIDGRGAVIALIDTGIDYTHLSFGGAGVTETFAANDPNVIEPGTFPTAKVIGGVDLAGPYYAPNCPVPVPSGAHCTSEPEPDDDPLEGFATTGSFSQGHGSHVAGIAAGMGSTYPGTSSMATPAGVAPGAKIVEVKIFGNPTGIANFSPSTRLTYDGLDWIVKHNLGLEVPGVPATDAEGNRIKINALNMSVGGSWGGGMQLYNDVIGRVVDSGVAAAFSAGNSGNLPYVLGSPGAAEMAVSVANSYASHEKGVMFGATWDGGEVSAVAYTSNEILAPALEYTPAITDVAMALYGLACKDATGHAVPPIQNVTGKVALVQRGTCNFSEKFDNAAKFGAIAVVVYSDDRPPSNMTGTCWPKWPCSPIPGVMISKTDGEAIRTALEAQKPVLATIEVYDRPELTNTINSSSSRGPDRFSGGVKPQITAPGSNILSVYAGTGFGAWNMSGTSMASPHVAGVSALLWQRNDQQKLGLTAAEISALEINYASTVIYGETGTFGPLASITRQGAGLVNAFASVKGSTIVRSDRGIAELGFGDVFASREATTYTRHLTIKNIGTQPKTYRLTTTFLYPETEGKGVSFAFEPMTVTVAAGMTETVRVDLRTDPAKMNDWALLGDNRASALADSTAYGAAEINGVVNVTEVDASGEPVSGGDVPRVPFNSLPHRASCVAAGTADFIDVSDGPDILTFRNSCAQPGGEATYVRLGTDPQEPGYPDKLNITDVGARWFTTGVTDTVHPTVTLQALEFAIHTAGTRRIPLDSQIRVYFDLNRDGQWDKVGWNVRLSTNQWGTLLGNLIDGTLEPDQASAVRADGSFFTFYEPFDISENTAVLRFFANHPEFGLGLDMTSGDEVFNFGVSIWDGTGDFELTDTFLGYDNAPDNLADGLNPGPNDNVAYVFDEQVVDCVKLSDVNGHPIPGLPELVAVEPVTGTMSVNVAGCQAHASDLLKPPIALMIHYPYNERDHEVAFLEFGKHVVFLPVTARGYDFRPEPEPTTEPVRPTDGPPPTPTP